MVKVKDRRTRTRIVGSEPIPLSEMKGSAGDQSVEERVDGISGRGDATRVRKRTGSTEPLPMSTMEMLEAMVAMRELWLEAEWIQAQLPSSRVGRPRKSPIAALLLYEPVAWELKTSMRHVERELRDPLNWERLCTAAAAAHPDQPTWRLPKGYPTRNRYMYFSRTCLELDEVLEGREERATTFALGVAQQLDLLNEAHGSLTHPDSRNIIVGDGTWMPAMFNMPSDSSPGAEPMRRCDPDAIPYHNGDQVCGRMVVNASVRGPGQHERVLFGHRFKPVSGVSDATVFTGLVAALAPRAHIGGVVYDMAMHGRDQERLADLGIPTIAKVQRTSKGKPPMANLGEHEFTLRDGTKKPIVVIAYDGTPGVEIPTGDGPHWMPMLRVQIRRQRRADGTYRWHGHWELSDHAAIPAWMRGAGTLIRHHSTAEERASGQLRNRAARMFPESDPDFVLYGLREDAESINHDIKDRLPNGRARRVGLRRQRITLLGYQTRNNMIALIAWHYRTGGDLSAWFGNWRPPPLQRQLAA